MKKNILSGTDILTSMRHNKLEKYIKKNTMNYSFDLYREPICSYESYIDSGRNVVMALNALSENDYKPQYEVHYENSNYGNPGIYMDDEEAFTDFRERFEKEEKESSCYLLCKLLVQIRNLNKCLLQNTENKRFVVLVKETLRKSKYKHITLEGLESLLKENIKRIKGTDTFEEDLSEEYIKIDPEMSIVAIDKLICDMGLLNSKQIQEVLNNICDHYSLKLKNMWKLSKEYNKYGIKLLRQLA